MLYAAGGSFWVLSPSQGAAEGGTATGTTRPPSRRAGRSPLECSHEESSWCSWRPLEWRARADGGWVCLACSTPSAIGPDRCTHRGVACTRSEPRALGAKCSVTLALERDTEWETLVSYELGPPTEEASLLLELANIRFASCVPF